MNLFARFRHFLMALARELSDEGPYARYLERNGRARSPAEWRHFSDQEHRKKYQNTKCC